MANAAFPFLFIVFILQKWTCTAECEDGRYGYKCQQWCHCQNDETCNKTNGQCLNGCDLMWTGEFCSQYKGMGFTLLKTTVSQSGTFLNNYANYAIDGVTNYDINSCRCCSVAETTLRGTWWQIDLGKEYLIDALSIFGRDDNSNQDQIQSATVYAGNQSLSGNLSSGRLVFTVPSNIGNRYHFAQQLRSPIIARAFIVTTQSSLLTICEFSLREKECPIGSFGEGCLHVCHCKNGTACDSVTGYCSENECDPGWKGDACNKQCDRLKFGDRCNNTCHCSSCEPVNGTCHTRCDPGWKGPSCSQENNIITAIKENVTTNTSSVYNQTWGSDLAIDGNIGPDPTACNCCAGTQNDAVSWWSIDLGQKYPIGSVTLFGRNEVAGFGQQLEGFEIFLSNSSSFDQTTSYKDNPEHIANAFIVQVHNQLARFIKVQRPGVLTLCEVSVQEGECEIGFFGTECSMVCKCLDKKPCRRIDGVCSTPSCELGWKGAACNSECLPGTFGEGCRESCFCANGDVCTKDYGLCPGRCRAGHHGPQCNKECSSGSFGEGCSHICHCKGNTNCDSVTGFCQERECDPGWQGDACDIQCDSLKFGDGCNSTCHCSSCEPVNGTCHTDCDIGWSGSSCSQENNIITAIKEKVTTSMSSVYNETWGSYLAIDGNIGPDPSVCKCCAETQNEAVSWWSIDMGQKYPIASITLFGRNKVPDIGQQLEGFEIILSNTSLYDQKTSYKNNTEQIANAYIVQVHNELARFIKVQRPGVLILCEISVQEGECRNGYFGTDCSMVCKCFDKKPCRRRDGVCSTSLCELGWRGAACDSECLPGTFGEECREQCFCANGTICTADYGICPGTCAAGYQGPHCNKECLPGTFGENCRENCSCANGDICTEDRGLCPGNCKAGYQGPQCHTECSSGSFGEGCSHICHCRGGTNCDSVTGFCQERECDPGWQGDACDIQCDSLKFGDGCNKTCHCSSCEPVIGTCHTECDLGWSGSSCSQEIDQGQKINSSVAGSQHSNTSLPITIGVSVGSSILVAAVALLIIFKKYGKCKENSPQNGTYEQPSSNKASKNSEYKCVSDSMSMETTYNQSNYDKPADDSHLYEPIADKPASSVESEETNFNRKYDNATASDTIERM